MSHAYGGGGGNVLYTYIKVYARASADIVAAAAAAAPIGHGQLLESVAGYTDMRNGRGVLAAGDQGVGHHLFVTAHSSYGLVFLYCAALRVSVYVERDDAEENITRWIDRVLF